ncbi:hypothetical protein Naga_100239g1, partial [Nannochloropsis gaditana]
MSNIARWTCGSTGSGDDRLISVQRGYVCGKCTRYEDRSRKRRRDGMKVFLSCAIISLVLPRTLASGSMTTSSSISFVQKRGGFSPQSESLACTSPSSSPPSSSSAPPSSSSASPPPVHVRANPSEGEGGEGVAAGPIEGSLEDMRGYDAHPSMFA